LQFGGKLPRKKVRFLGVPKNPHDYATFQGVKFYLNIICNLRRQNRFRAADFPSQAAISAVIGKFSASSGDFRP